MCHPHIYQPMTDLFCPWIWSGKLNLLILSSHNILLQSVLSSLCKFFLFLLVLNLAPTVFPWGTTVPVLEEMTTDIYSPPVWHTFLAHHHLFSLFSKRKRLILLSRQFYGSHPISLMTLAALSWTFLSPFGAGMIRTTHSIHVVVHISNRCLGSLFCSLFLSS